MRIWLSVWLVLSLSSCASDSGVSLASQDFALDDAPDYLEPVTIRRDGQTSDCHGVMISPRAVLTTRGCAPAGQNLDAGNDALSRAAVLEIAIIEHEAEPGAAPSPELDYAMLRLEKPLDAVTFATLGGSIETSADSLTAVRWLADKAEPLATPCTIAADTLESFQFHATRPVEPGSPVFLSGTHSLVALATTLAAGEGQVMARLSPATVQQIRSQGRSWFPTRPSGDTSSSDDESTDDSDDDGDDGDGDDGDYWDGDESDDVGKDETDDGDASSEELSPDHAKDGCSVRVPGSRSGGLLALLAGLALLVTRRRCLGRAPRNR